MKFKQYIQNTLNQGDNVIIGYTYCDNNNNVIGGHEITIIGIETDNKGQKYFICNDTDDGVSEPIKYKVDELLPKRRCIDVGPAIERQQCRPWLRIVFPVLDQDAGLHIYKITFVNRYTDDVVSAYISYTIQDDNPNKPYIYMRQEDASGDE